MSKIACKLKNSMAINSKGEIYTWGACGSGLLGCESISDVNVPQKIPLTYANSNYYADTIACGHFHAACIAKRDGADLKIDLDLKFAKTLFKSIRSWYENVFLKKIQDYKELLKILLKLYKDEKTVKFEK